MKTLKIIQVIAFVVACVATCFAWQGLRPEAREELAALPVSKPRHRLWSPEKTTALLEELQNAQSNEAKLNIARRMGEIPVSQVREALDQTPLIENRTLTISARLLIIRWAAEDGPAAVDWAWKRLRSEGVWTAAFQEITASWAWHHPEELCEWTKKLAADRKPGLGTIRLEEAMASDQPMLDFEAVSWITGCLVSVAPREAMEILKMRGGMSSDDSRLFESIPTVSKVREALLAFDHLDQLRPDHFTGSQMNAMALLQRWKQLDSEDFARSPYAHLIPDPKSYPPPPVPDGPPGWLREFDQMGRTLGDRPPDTNGWTADKIEAWKDYLSLKGNDLALEP